MAKYNVLAAFTSYGNVEVEANSAEHAKFIASNLDGGDFITDDNMGDFEIVRADFISAEDEAPAEFAVKVLLKLSGNQDHSLLSVQEAVHLLIENAFENDINYGLTIDDLDIQMVDKIQLFKVVTPIGFFKKGDILLVWGGANHDNNIQYLNVTLEMNGAGTWSRWDIPTNYLTPMTEDECPNEIEYLKNK